MTDVPKATPSDRGAMGVDAFCAWAGIGRSKFYGEVSAGRIKLRKIGRKSIVTMNDAQTCLDSLPTFNVTEAA